MTKKETSNMRKNLSIMRTDMNETLNRQANKPSKQRHTDDFGHNINYIYCKSHLASMFAFVSCLFICIHIYYI